MSDLEQAVLKFGKYTVAQTNNNHDAVTWVLACGVVGNWSEERS